MGARPAADPRRLPVPDVVTAKRCPDCVTEGVTTRRRVATDRNGNPVPAGRCATHHRAKRTQRRDTAWERHLMATYGLSAADYWAVYEAQNGRCYICGRGKGQKTRLAVDHCHETGVVRGLLCKACNRDVLGHLRDEVDALQRAIDYLTDPPAVSAIGVRITPDLT